MSDTVPSYAEMETFSKLISNKIREFYRDRVGIEVEANICAHGVVQQIVLLASFNPSNDKFGRIPLSATYMVFSESLMLKYYHGLRNYTYVAKSTIDTELMKSNLDRYAPESYSDYSWERMVTANYWLNALINQHENARATVNRLRGRRFVSETKLATLASLQRCLAYLIGYVRAYINDPL